MNSKKELSQSASTSASENGGDRQSNALASSNKVGRPFAGLFSPLGIAAKQFRLMRGSSSPHADRSLPKQSLFYSLRQRFVQALEGLKQAAFAPPHWQNMAELEKDWGISDKNRIRFLSTQRIYLAALSVL
ncbi:MAG: hypothetical protein AAF197_01225, partial [Pseudomonadota bacterium]